jgi:hypothetical protein
VTPPVLNEAWEGAAGETNTTTAALSPTVEVVKGLQLVSAHRSDSYSVGSVPADQQLGCMLDVDRHWAGSSTNRASLPDASLLYPPFTRVPFGSYHGASWARAG